MKADLDLESIVQGFYHGLAGEQDNGWMARYIVSVREGAIVLSQTCRDVNVIERQVHLLKERPPAVLFNDGYSHVTRR